MSGRWWATASAAFAGAVSGALATLALQSAALDRPPPAPAPAADQGADVAAVPVPTPGEQVLLVWTPQGLPHGLGARLGTIPGVGTVTVVAGDRVDLTAVDAADGRAVQRLPHGWAIPVDALAVDPATYARFVPGSQRAAIAGLRRGEAVLGSTSARVRGVGVGGRLKFTQGPALTIAAVVDDAVVGGAEVVVARDTAQGLGIRTTRFALVAFAGDRAATEAAVRRAVGGSVRVRGAGETPYLRHGDGVLPQALVKARFGEFSYRPPAAGRDFHQDPAWAAEHIATVDIPVVGEVRCHRGIVRQLRGALDELERQGLAHLVDPEAFAGCHNPRLVAPDGGVSRHAWGIAVDLNAATNPTGRTSGQDKRLVETMRRWGFTWGGFWLVPDPMHFEYLQPLEPVAVKVLPGG